MVVKLDDICTLCDENHRVELYAQGPTDAKIMVVGKMKNSAQYQSALELQLTELGLDVSDIYFTPVIKCRSFDVSLTNKQLKDHAAEYFTAEVERINPRYILALGNEALLALTGKSGITKYRGRSFERGNADVIGSISPSSVKRNPGQKPAYIADLRLFVNKVKGRAVGIPEPKYITGDTKEKLHKIWRILDMTDEIFIDVETTHDEYYQPIARMISVAATCIVRKPDGSKGRVVFAIPLSHPQSPWRNQWEQVLRVMGKHVAGIRKVVAHNASFDCKWLIWKSVKLYPTFDTMLAIHLLNENVQRGLKPQAMARLGVEPWGIDTGTLDKQPIADVLHYNVLDTWYMYWVKLQLVEELKEQPRIARIFMLETMPAQRELIDSEMRGIWVDVPLLKSRQPEGLKRLQDTEAKIREAAQLPSKDSDDWPASFKELKSGTKRIPLDENFNASRFAKWMLFEWCGLPVVERGKVKPNGDPGDPSMAEDVLQHLKGEHPVVEHMLDRVTKNKHMTSFLNPYMELYDDDHRIHTTFKLAGTVTGRLSSGKSDADKISGTRGKMRGVNLQQVPRDPFIKGVFGAPPGWTFVESDYSQIELRIAALLADETTMKHLYSIGADIHTTTAARVAGLAESAVSKEVRKKLGKPVNFGFLYAMGWKTFIDTAFNNYGAVFNEEEARGARKTYFDLYPKLLPWHAKQRRLVNEYGRVQSPLGRVRHLPDIYSPDQQVRNEAERQAINSPVQGFASDLAVLAMIEINTIFRRKGIEGYCLGLVHDAINYEIRNDYLAQGLPIIKDTMEDMGLVYKKFGTVVDIPIVADVAVGSHWGEKLELTPEQVYDFKLEYAGH